MPNLDLDYTEALLVRNAMRDLAVKNRESAALVDGWDDAEKFRQVQKNCETFARWYDTIADKVEAANPAMGAYKG